MLPFRRLSGTLALRSFLADDVLLLQLGADRIVLAIECARLFAVEQAVHRQAEGALHLRENFFGWPRTSS